MSVHVRAMLDLKARGRGGVRLRQQPAGPGGRPPRACARRSTSRVSCRRSSARCSARAPGRSAGPRSPAIRRTSRRPTGRCWRPFPKKDSLARWIRQAQERVQFQGLPARICWLEYGERAEMGLRFNWLVQHGKVAAPIVIGRDHLDTGSVASPNRETEGMRDGSDAIADWPLLNALLNTACGASWVSLHHGGGVGIGYSIHAGMVAVADGTDSGRPAARAGAHRRSRHRRHAPRGRGVRAGDRDRARAGRRPADAVTDSRKRPPMPASRA